MTKGVGLVIRLVLLSLVVGIVLTFFDLRPSDLFYNTRAKLEALAELVLAIARWAGPYILTGAEIVVPVAVIAYLVQRRRRST